MNAKVYPLAVIDHNILTKSQGSITVEVCTVALWCRKLFLEGELGTEAM